ncbi:MAG: leucine--tRNA ligase, partial [Bacteroidetes bacterium]|nr:leucine--tRNA ligase [Bacteroidota bacterium]
VARASKRSERERQAEVKNISGAFTGGYCINPFTEENIPVWVAEYVLMGYGTGAIMSVPAHDSRDYDFAKHFDLPIIEVVSGGDISSGSYDAKEGKLMNSGFMDGMEVTAAIKAAIQKVKDSKLGEGQINYKLHDAAFSRQRYWGEPFPVYYNDEMPYHMDVSELPLELPEIDSYKPTSDGEPPLARAKNWKTADGLPIETDTMPGYAGSSWYFFRYMDPDNDNEFVSKEAQQYWEAVDLYVGGAEHATGHLLYARFWTHFLFDKGHVTIKEPFKKMINQGMIQGRSNLVYRLKDSNTFVSHGLKDQHDELTAIHVDVNIVENDILDLDKFKATNDDYAKAEYILEDGKYVCGWEVEKMSKQWYNVVNPDDIMDRYSTDTFRMYEMFLGPIEVHKPWDTNGIDGVHRFLKRFWRMYFDDGGNFTLSEDTATDEELKVLHKTLKKVNEDIERFAFNTAVSAFMVCTNELMQLNCSKKEVLEPLVTLIAPFAPHMAEELYELMGNTNTVVDAPYPSHNEEYIKEDTFNYPVAINGKVRDNVDLPLDMDQESVEKVVLDREKIQKWLDGKPPKKIILVQGRMINVVV